MLDSRGRQVSPKSSHAALSRALPGELGSIPAEDQDELSFLFIAPSGVDLDAIEVLTRNAVGKPLDVLPQLRALPTTCPDRTAPELICRKTPAIRTVDDALDRSHSATQKRTILAQVGGTLRLSSAGRKLDHCERSPCRPRQTTGLPLSVFLSFSL